MSVNNSEECHFLHLNDDCLFDIWKYLSISDWCSLRETCTRLRTVSDICFGRQLSSFELDGNYISGSIYNELEMKDIRPLFRNFGQFFSKLTINAKMFPPNEDLSQVVPLLHRYCIALQDLKLVKIEFNADRIVQCDRLFSNLERLVIDSCSDDDTTFATCLAHCRSLKELEVIRLFKIDGTSLVHQHNTLESFSMKSCDNLDAESIHQFLVQNPQLKKLKFVSCYIVTDQIFKHISDNLPNLEALSVRLTNVQRTINENVMHVLRLSKLKKFEINCGLTGINSFLNGLATHNPIEILHLATAEITNESIQALCDVKTLKILKFTMTIQLNGGAFRKLATELPNLSEIHIIECSKITLNDVKEFAEHSTTVQKVVFIRYDDDAPSATKDIFLSLIEARQRNPNKETLNVYLDFDDHREVKDQFMWDGNLRLLSEQAHIVNLLPLEEEDDKLPVYEYGGGGNRRAFRMVYEDIETQDDIFDYDEFDDYDDYDGYDDYDDYDDADGL